MKCLTKIHHRRLIYSFLFVVFSLFLSVLGSASDSYAISGSCTITGNISSSSRVSIPISDCVSGNYYFKLTDFSYSYTGNFSYISVSVMSVYPNSTGNFSTFTSSGSSGSYSSFDSLVVPNFYYLDSTFTPASSTYNNFVVSFGPNYPSGNGSVTLTFSYSDNLSDFVSGSGSCPDPTPCPPIPENPYDDKLDEIIKAIYCASAVMIMIYFFFIVYKIIVKDGGRR